MSAYGEKVAALIEKTCPHCSCLPCICQWGIHGRIATRSAALKARIEAEHPVRSLDKRARELEATGVPLMEAYRRAVDEEVERLKR